MKKILFLSFFFSGLCFSNIYTIEFRGQIVEPTYEKFDHIYKKNELSHLNQYLTSSKNIEKSFTSINENNKTILNVFYR